MFKKIRELKEQRNYEVELLKIKIEYDFVLELVGHPPISFTEDKVFLEIGNKKYIQFGFTYYMAVDKTIVYYTELKIYQPKKGK